MTFISGIAVGSAVATSALAQVEVTAVTRGVFLHLESMLDGSVDVSESSTDFGHYALSTYRGLGDPLAAYGHGNMETEVTPDGGTIGGTMFAQSLSVTTDTNSGYNYTESGCILWFTLQSQMEIEIVRHMTVVANGGGFAYHDLQLWDVTNDTELLRDDWWGDDDYVDDVDRELLLPGDYRLTLLLSGEGEYPPPPLGDNGERTAYSSVAFGVTFVPAPASTMACLGAFWWVRRRR